MSHFTKGELEEIFAGLSKKLIRDSEFIEADGLLEGDFFTIVQGGVNKRYPVSSFVGDIRKKDVNISVGTVAWWAEHDYVPSANELIVYSDYQQYTDTDGNIVTVPGLKIGSGNAYLSDLAFIGEADSLALAKHIADAEVHITSAERTKWNGKLNVDDGHEVDGECLIFNRN